MLPFVLGFAIAGGTFLAVDSFFGMLLENEVGVSICTTLATMIFFYILSWQLVAHNHMLATHGDTLVMLQIPLFGFTAGMLCSAYIQHSINTDIKLVLTITAAIAFVAWVGIAAVAFTAYGFDGKYSTTFLASLGTNNDMMRSCNCGLFSSAVQDRFVQLATGPVSWIGGLAAYGISIIYGTTRKKMQLARA